MAASFAQLPAELLKVVFNRVQPKDLSNLRLVSWRLENVAREELFLQYTVPATTEGVRNLQQVLTTEHLKKCVKHLTWVGLVPVESQDLSHELENSIRRCCRFTALSSVTMSFGHDFYNRCGEAVRRFDRDRTMAFRTRMLSMLLWTLASSTHTTPYFQTLSIVGIANHNYAALVAHPKFLSVFERLRGLNLCFKVSGPPQFFFGPFASAWFAPVMSNLTTLTLLSETFWGYWPKVDLSQLVFPRLQVLALGKYTFSHDWQLKWITKHQELQKLYLYDCPIVKCTRILDDFDEDGYPFSLGTQFFSGPERIRIYDATWSIYLDEMRNSLLELQVFKMFHETDEEREIPRHFYRPYFETYEDMETCLRPSRYMKWDAVKPEEKQVQTYLFLDSLIDTVSSSIDRDSDALMALQRNIEARRCAKNIE